MLATAIIVFRETLEAALSIGIVMAACQGVEGRRRWIGAGLVFGLAGACLVAAFAGAIAMAAAGIGQELLNAAILGTAVVMLSWHVLFMARHGQEMAREARDLGADVRAGRRPLLALAVVVGLAVLREGSETVLFLYGVVSGGDSDPAGMVLGGLLGAAAGTGAGVLLYAGLVRLPVGAVFRVTNGLIVLLAAGMAAQAAGFLVQADLLPALGSPAWDTSHVLSQNSIAGKVLHGLIGYEARPAGIQAILYAAVLIVLWLLTRAFSGGADGGRRVSLAAAIILLAATE
jgi:high-affinity iron transporter